MEDIKPGDLVFLTQAYEKYVYERNTTLKVNLVNRVAKLEEIIDWESDKGKKIKDARLQSGKWAKLPLEDNKYIFSIYYQDIVGRKGKQGVIERGVPLFSKDPETGEPFFTKIPDWLYIEFLKGCQKFNVEKRDINPAVLRAAGNKKSFDEFLKEVREESENTPLAVIKAFVKNNQDVPRSLGQ